MKKIAFFVEGQTERIFIEKLIEEYYSYPDYDIISSQLKSNRLMTVRRRRKKDAVEYLFIVIDASCDTRVLSAIKERADTLYEAGVSRIFGIRDLFPGKKTDEQIILENVNRVIMDIKSRDIITFIIAVMEIEAWFLTDIDLFKRINPQLTADRINEQVSIDITDTEKYPHPARIIDSIFQLVNLRYKKREKDVYKIANYLDYENIFCNNKIRGANKSFELFLDHFEGIADVY